MQKSGMMRYAGFGARQLTAGIHLMTGCFDSVIFGIKCHTHLSAYLVCGEHSNLLVDTGHTKDFHNFAAYISSVIGSNLTYIFPTHEEYPHSGSLGLMLDAFPSAKVIGETRNYHLYYPEQYKPERFLQRRIGDVIDLGGRRLEILPAVIQDLQTYWAYDDADRTLFVSDGFAFSHYQPSECTLLSDELPNKPTASDARLVLDTALAWTRDADNRKLVAELQAMLQKYDTRMICPAHGSVITNPTQLLAVMEEALTGTRVAPATPEVISRAG